MQPILSEACARSMVLVATAGCQRSWPLKSRSTFQTAPVGALRTVLLTICGTLASEGALQRVEAALKHAGPDITDQPVLALARAAELARPFHQRLVPLCHRHQPQPFDSIL